MSQYESIRPSRRWCEHHRMYGHATEECIALKREQRSRQRSPPQDHDDPDTSTVRRRRTRWDVRPTVEPSTPGRLPRDLSNDSRPQSRSDSTVCQHCNRRGHSGNTCPRREQEDRARGFVVDTVGSRMPRRLQTLSPVDELEDYSSPPRSPVSPPCLYCSHCLRYGHDDAACRRKRTSPRAGVTSEDIDDLITDQYAESRKRNEQSRLEAERSISTLSSSGRASRSRESQSHESMDVEELNDADRQICQSVKHHQPGSDSPKSPEWLSAEARDTLSSARPRYAGGHSSDPSGASQSGDSPSQTKRLTNDRHYPKSSPLQTLLRDSPARSDAMMQIDSSCSSQTDANAGKLLGERITFPTLPQTFPRISAAESYMSMPVVDLRYDSFQTNSNIGRPLEGGMTYPDAQTIQQSPQLFQQNQQQQQYTEGLLEQQRQATRLRQQEVDAEQLHRQNQLHAEQLQQQQAHAEKLQQQQQNQHQQMLQQQQMQQQHQQNKPDPTTTALDFTSHLSTLQNSYCAICLCAMPSISFTFRPQLAVSKEEAAGINFHKHLNPLCTIHATHGVPEAQEALFWREACHYFKGYVPWCETCGVLGHIRDREQDALMVGTGWRSRGDGGELEAVKLDGGGVCAENWSIGKGGLTVVIPCSCVGVARETGKGWAALDEVVEFCKRMSSGLKGWAED